MIFSIIQNVGRFNRFFSSLLATINCVTPQLHLCTIPIAHVTFKMYDHGWVCMFTLSESNTLLACSNTVSTCPQSGYFRKYSHRNTESIDLFNVFRRTVNPKWTQDILRKKYPALWCLHVCINHHWWNWCLHLSVYSKIGLFQETSSCWKQCLLILLKIPTTSFYCFTAIYNSFYLIVLFAVLHSFCWSVARACILLCATSINWPSPPEWCNFLNYVYNAY